MLVLGEIRPEESPYLFGSKWAESFDIFRVGSKLDQNDIGILRFFMIKTDQHLKGVEDFIEKKRPALDI